MSEDPKWTAEEALACERQIEELLKDFYPGEGVLADLDSQNLPPCAKLRVLQIVREITVARQVDKSANKTKH